MPPELSTQHRDRLKILEQIAEKGEIAILEKVFELQEALAEAQARIEYIQNEQMRDKSMTVTVDQPPVDLAPVINALTELKNALPQPEKQEKLDLSPIIGAIRDLQNTMATEQQFSDTEESTDYTEMLGKLLEALTKPNREQEIIDLLAKPSPTFEIPSYLINNGRIKVEVDRTGGGIASRLHDARGVAIDPANKALQESILSALTQVYTTRIDDVTPVTYIGQAVPGTAVGAASWRILKIDETNTPDIVNTYAGTGVFDQVWDNRASLSYS